MVPMFVTGDKRDPIFPDTRPDRVWRLRSRLICRKHTIRSQGFGRCVLLPPGTPQDRADLPG